MIAGLAARLGRMTFATDPEEVFAELGRASAGGRADYAGITYDRIRDEHGVFWPCPDADHPGTPRLFAESFAHADGRARFVAVEHRGPAEPVDADVPAAPDHRPGARAVPVRRPDPPGPRAARRRAVRRAAPDARRPDRGVRRRSRSSISTRRGELKAPARVVDTIRPDTVFVPFHWVGANRLTNDALDPSSRMPEFKVCACAVSADRSGAQVGSRPVWTSSQPNASRSPRPRCVSTSASVSTAAHRMRVVIVGAGMAATRLAEEPGRTDVTCSATRRTRRTTGSCCPRCSRARTRRTAWRCRCRRRRPAARHPGRRDPPRRAGGRARRPIAGCRTTSWCSPPAASRRCRRSAAWSGSTAGCTRRCTRSAASTTASASTPRRRHARSAVVVGGGLLGLQVARALGVRGLATEIVEGGDHLLRSQVDAKAGAILARDLKRLGTAVYTGARAVRLTDAGLVLDNGYTLDTDLVVLTAGGRPSTALARRAGLEVRRGVVVDHLLRTSDPHIHAIGDCAQHGDQVTGFVPPAWEQAGLLARHLNGEEVRYDGARTVARLRATDLDVAVLGDPERTDGEVVEVSNPVTGTHRKLVVRDGVIVGATLVGDLSRIGLITQHYDRRHGARPARARRPADGRARRRPRRAARRRRGLRLRRRQRRPGPGLRLARRGPRDHPRHHRLRRLHQRRPRARHGRSTRMSPHLRKKLVVVGHGMVGHRFVQAAIERGLTETHDVVVIGEEPRPAYDRVGADLVLRGRRRRAVAAAGGPVRRPAGHASASARPSPRSRPGSGSSRSPTARTCTTTSWCSPPAPRRSCRRCRATT